MLGNRYVCPNTDNGRLALSHNLLQTLPLRLIECKRLRYLNVRYNSMREIPEAVRPTLPRAASHRASPC